MTTDTLTFPPLDATEVKAYPAPGVSLVDTAGANVAAQPPSVVSVVSVENFVVGKLRHSEPLLRALATKYAGQKFDVSTAKGLDATRAARHDLRENGRFAVQRLRDDTKKALNNGKTALDKEADRLIALVQPEEDRLHALIEAREAQLAAEKAERERIEAERVAKHRQGIETIRGYVAQAQGKTAAEIAEAVDYVTGQIAAEVFPAAAWQEFADEARDAWGTTLDCLLRLLATAKAREAEAARIEAQRVEQARVAAEQAERQRALDEQAAELRRRQEAIDAQERAADALREQARFEGQERVANMADAQTPLGDLPADAPRHPMFTDPCAPTADAAAVAPAPQSDYLPASQAAAPLPGPGPVLSEKSVADANARAFIDAIQPAAEQPTLTIGKINDRLGLIVNAEFLASLGFEATAVKNARLFKESSFKRICAAIAEHVLKAAEQQP